jgi:hypothetical protein
VWWTVFEINRARVSQPVLGLIDLAAEKVGFWPILGGKAVDPKTIAAASPQHEIDVDEDAEPSVA